MDVVPLEEEAASGGPQHQDSPFDALLQGMTNAVESLHGACSARDRPSISCDDIECLVHPLRDALRQLSEVRLIENANCTAQRHEKERLQKRVAELAAKNAALEERGRLGALRGSELFQRVLRGETLADPAKAESGGRCSDPHCNCTDGDNCPHRSMLASNIINNTFDEARRVLRARLVAAEKELQGFRSGEAFRALQAQLNDALRRARDREDEIESLRLRLVDEMVERRRLRAAQPGAAVAGAASAPSALVSATALSNELRSCLSQALALHQYALGLAFSVAEVAFSLKADLLLGALLSTRISSPPPPPPSSSSSAPHPRVDDELKFKWEGTAAQFATATTRNVAAPTGRPLSRHRAVGGTMMIREPMPPVDASAVASPLLVTLGTREALASLGDHKSSCAPRLPAKQPGKAPGCSRRQQGVS